VRALFAENKVRFARVEQLWLLQLLLLLLLQLLLLQMRMLLFRRGVLRESWLEPERHSTVTWSMSPGSDIAAVWYWYLSPVYTTAHSTGIQCNVMRIYSHTDSASSNNCLLLWSLKIKKNNTLRTRTSETYWYSALALIIHPWACCRRNNVIIDSCMASFGLVTVSELVDKRKNRFLLKLNFQDNLLGLCII